MFTGFGVGGSGTGALLNTGATPEEKRRAYDINFDCLTSVRECRKACELMPSAWREQVQRHRTEGRPPLREESDARCQAVLAAGEKKQP